MHDEPQEPHRQPQPCHLAYNRNMEWLGKSRSNKNGSLTLEFLAEYSAAVQVDLQHALSRTCVNFFVHRAPISFETEEKWREHREQCAGPVASTSKSSGSRGGPQVEAGVTETPSITEQLCKN